MKQSKFTILYERLSVDDERAGESVSIQNQKKILEDYATKNGFTNLLHLTDDGISGTRFDRPGFVKMMDEVEAGNVSTVLIKDMSRLGRDYLRVGLCMETLRDKGVRLIAVADGVDTAMGDDDFTPFRNIMAEWHARDTSKKIRAVFNSRTADGKHVSGAIPYGYIRDKNDNQKWIVDEEAAEIVRRIFRMIIEGKGVYQIAAILESEKILIPSAHWDAIGADNPHTNYSEPYRWRGGTVSGIIAREEYMGRMILRKTHTESYKHKKRKKTSAEERLVFEGAIPVIIDEETWHNAQRLRRTVRRSAKNGAPPYRLTGLLYCADCGAKMTHNRTEYLHSGHKTMKDDYVCSNYRHYTRNCSMHFIRTAAVEEIVLSVVKRACEYVRKSETAFIERVRDASSLQQESAVRENKKRLAKSKRRHEELDGLIKKLYESYALEKIPENHFSRLLAEYDEEQKSLGILAGELQTQVDTFVADSARAEKFIELVRQYTDFEELSTVMLNSFVEKIIVHECDKSSGKRIQKVDVHLNFIGQFDLPEEEVVLTPEQIEAERRREARRAVNRASARRCRERKKNEDIESA